MVLTDSRSANELLAAFVRSGDESLFEEVVRRYAGMVYHVAFRVTKNPHDAEDATQAAFLSLAVQCRSGKQIIAIGPWLQQVAHRLALDIRRSHRRRDAREAKHFELNRDRLSDGGNHNGNGEHNGDGDYFGGYDSEELRHLVSQAIDQLPSRYRMPMVLLYFGGMSREQIARELRCKVSTLAVRIHRGRDMVRKHLSKRGIVLSLDGLTLLLCQTIRSHVGAGLIEATSSVAGQLAQGLAVDPVSVSAQVLALARHAAQGAVIARLRMAVASVIVLAPMLLAGGKMVSILPTGTLDLSAPVRWMGDTIRNLLSDSVRVPSLRVSNEPAAPVAPVLPLEPIVVPPPVVQPLARASSSSPAHASPAGAPAPVVVWSTQDRPSISLTPAPLRVGATDVPVAPQRVALDVARPTSLSSGESTRSEGKSTPAVSGGGAVANGNSSESTSETENTDKPFNSADSYFASMGGGGGGGGSGGARSKMTMLQQVASAASSKAANVSVAGSSAYDIIPVSTRSQKVPAPSSTTDSTSQSTSADALEIQPASIISATNGTFNTVIDQYLSVDRSSRDGRLVAWGTMPGDQPFYVNGKVIADGQRQNKALDMSGVQIVTDTENNRLGGTIGWYARNTGELILPAQHVFRGDTRLTWGESADDKTLDLVNSARVTMHGVASEGDVQISLLSLDNHKVPTLPGGHHFLAVWSYENSAQVDGLTDLLVRYDSELAAANGLNEAILKLWVYDQNRWIRIMDSTFGRDVKEHLIWGSYGGNFQFFAVSAPEPTGVALLIASSLLLARRTNRRKRN